MPFEKPIEQLTEADLQELISNRVSERRAVEYKTALPGTNDEAKKEFLADISSFANSVGGHLVYGVKEKEGLPIALAGLTVFNPDQEKLRLESIIRSGVSPRLPGVELSELIPISSGGSALVIRVPRSWISPHMVVFGNHSKFYSRNSAGKYQLNVEELRSAFGFAQATKEKMRDFRADRISQIIADRGPVPTISKALVVLHVMPLSAFETDRRFDAHVLGRIVGFTAPLYSERSNLARYNFDGYLACDWFNDDRGAVSYLQAFRTGVLESVGASLMFQTTEIPSLDLERSLIRNNLPGHISILKRLGVPPPIFFGLSLLGVSGFTMGQPRSAASFAQLHRSKITEDVLVVPEVMAETYETNLGAIFRPVFDSIWNAAGEARSPYYEGDR